MTSRAWSRWVPRGVQARSAAAATLVLALVLAVACLALVLLLQRSLTASLESTATAQARDIGAVVGAGDLGPTPAGARELSETVEAVAGRTSLAQVVGPSGEVVASTANLAGAAPLPSPALEARGVSASDESVSLRGDVDEYRVVALAGTVDGQGFSVVVGRSLEGVEDTRNSLLLLLGLGVPVLLVAVWVATSYYVGRSLAPVGAITAAVAGIGDADLRRRVPVPDARDEVADLAATMNLMLERLQGAREAQRRFVADASHELRSPVATLRAAAEVELASSPAPCPTGADATADGALAPLVLTEAVRMQRLVDDLLVLARVDGTDHRGGGVSGPGAPATLVHEEVDVDDLVLAERSRLRATTTLVVDADIAPARVMGDPHQLSRVVRNLADNAARHAATRVVLTLAQRGGDAVLEVVDDGPGIPAADRQRVFERFVRLDDSRERGSGGTGLGLAIVAGIVGVHGGTVRAGEASPPPGALVRVVLPLAEAAAGRSPGGQPAASTPVASST